MLNAKISKRGISDVREDSTESPRDSPSNRIRNRHALKTRVGSKSLFVPSLPTCQEPDDSSPPMCIWQQQRRGALTCDTTKKPSPPGDLDPSPPGASISPPTMWDEQLQALKQTIQTTPPHTPSTRRRTSVKASVKQKKLEQEIMQQKTSSTVSTTVLEISPPAAPPTMDNQFHRKRRMLVSAQQQQRPKEEEMLKKSVKKAYSSDTIKNVDGVSSQKSVKKALSADTINTVDGMSSSQKSPRRVPGIRGSASWKSLLPGSGGSLKKIEVPEDPGGKNTSILHGGTLRLSTQMKISAEKLSRTDVELKAKKAKKKKQELLKHISDCCGSYNIIDKQGVKNR